jgi:flagellar motor switch protein FliM
MKRESAQHEIEFQRTAGGIHENADETTSFDFNRLDRIPKSQLRALQALHENFTRNLASSLSAYLRCSATLNLISLEQVSYSEFVDCLASPTCLAYIGMRPFDGAAVLEMNSGLMFGLLELLLGGNGKVALNIHRKLTEIETYLIQMLMRVILRDLSEAWKGVASIRFSAESIVSEPQALTVLSPTEAVVAVAIEVRVGSSSGVMNLAIPSILIKRLRHKFDQLREIRRAESTVPDQAHLSQLIQDTRVVFEACIQEESISAGALLELKVGDLLLLDHPMDGPVNGFLNGCPKWLGSIVIAGDRLAFELRGGMAG